MATVVRARWTGRVGKLGHDYMVVVMIYYGIEVVLINILV